MPSPAITCFLVVAVIAAQVSILAGLVLAITCGIVQFLLPLAAP